MREFLIDLEYGTYNRIMSGRPKSSTLILVEHVSGVIDISSVLEAAGVKHNLETFSFTLSADGPEGRLSDTAVKLLRSYPHFGGIRYWFRCPGCGRRCGRLYATESHQRVACRQCHGLRYYLQHDKALAGAYFHWAFRRGGGRSGFKKAAQFFAAWEGCRERGEKFNWGRRS
jgi:hypothetical protein